MAEAKKKYYEELNIFRSIIVIFVVAGHSFDAGRDFFGLIHNYVYSFHMDAFFVLSGILFAKKIKELGGFKDCALLIKDRFLRLMIPYVFYTAVSIVLKLFLDDYANNKLSVKVIISSLLGVQNPNGGIWFLYALFVLNVIAVILHKIPKIAGLIITLGLYIANMKTDVFSNIPIVIFIVFYGVFFYLGLFIADYYDEISASMNEFVKKRLLVTGAVSVLYIPAAFIITVFLISNMPNSSVIRLMLVIMNIVVYYLLSVVINSLVKVKKPFMTIGDYGIDIYLIGYYVQITLRVLLKSMLGAPYIVYSIAMFIFGLLLPIPISKYIVRRFWITRMLALGSYKKSTPKEVKTDGEET